MDSNNSNDPGMMELTRNIMVMSIIFLFIVIMCVFVVHFCPKRRRQETEDANNCTCEQRGVDDSLLKTIQVVRFDPERFKEGLECVVCLSEVKEGEETRVLPECDHGFHMECVDMWFRSHSTCPVCRKPVVDQPEMRIERQESVTVMVEGEEASNDHLGSDLERV